MDAIQQRTVVSLSHMATCLRKSALPPEFSVDIERLAAQVEEPCVVAIVGRVKAGKSTFINALLGEENDWAKVGTTETTATINYFRYGVPEDSARPVRCHWRRGGYTDVDQTFLNGLQGNDLETLRRAEGIAHLDYFLPIPLLKQVTLVDTPGLNAVVDEHQNRTAEFMQLHGQLRERHHQETERIGETADAVVYLIGAVARSNDRDFLEEFTQATGGRSHAINAVGVIAKVDLQPEIMARRHELAGKVAAQLKDGLNTVVPVSAGLRRALDALLADDGAGLRRLTAALRRIPPPTLETLLDSDDLFLDYEPKDCPVSKKERRELLGQMQWAVFTCIAREATRDDAPVEVVGERLAEAAGFDTLRKLLEQRFFQRSHLLRCYRIVNDARKVLTRIKIRQLPQMRKGQRADEERLARFQKFIWQTSLDVTTALELDEFLRRHLDAGARSRALARLTAELDELLSRLFHELEEYNSDFAALQLLADAGDRFTAAEVSELRSLFGMYGTGVEKRLGGATPDFVRRRQLAWRQVEAESAHGGVRRFIAACATERYGSLLYRLNSTETKPSGFFRGARATSRGYSDKQSDAPPDGRAAKKG